MESITHKKQIYYNKNNKQEVVGFDETSFCGELAYGYSNKKEAIKAIEDLTGEKIMDKSGMQKLKVKRFIREDGEIYYTWAKKCNHCGQKIVGGVWSWADFY